MNVSIGLRCDAGRTMGSGHLVRCLALAEELLARGYQVQLLGDIDQVPWALAEVERLGIPRHPATRTPEELVAAARRLSLAAVVIDSYVLDPRCAGALRAAGVPVLAVVDGDLRGQEADLYLDQNLDAEAASPPLPPGATRLAGVRFALLRDVVRRRRPPAPRAPKAGVPTVVAFFGGTDPFGAAPVLARLLVATGAPFTATVVTATAHAAEEIAAIACGPGQRLTAIGNTPDLPGLVHTADLVVSAAGTSTWELLCLGVCPALVRVADNQRIGYDRMLARGLAVGLGAIDELRHPGPAADRAVRELAALLADPARRAEIAGRGWALVDGAGRERVADALLAAIDRRASLADAARG